MTAIKIEIKKFPINFKICFDEYLNDIKTEKKEMCHNIISDDNKEMNISV